MISKGKNTTGSTEYKEHENLPGFPGAEARLSKEDRLSIGGKGWGVSVNAFLSIADVCGKGQEAREAVGKVIPGY